MTSFWQKTKDFLYEHTDNPSYLSWIAVPIVACAEALTIVPYMWAIDPIREDYKNRGLKSCLVRSPLHLTSGIIAGTGFFIGGCTYGVVEGCMQTYTRCRKEMEKRPPLTAESFKCLSNTEAARLSKEIRASGFLTLQAKLHEDFMANIDAFKKQFPVPERDVQETATLAETEKIQKPFKALKKLER